jgi:Ca2+-binding EF-hand superfamily protein
MSLKLAAGAVAAAVFTGAALAQTPPTAAPAQEQTLTRAELTQKIDGEFKAFDTNADGKIGKAEIQAAVDKMTAGAAAERKQRQEDEFRKLDTDKNGQLSLAEYQAAVKITPKAGIADQRLQALDTNKDGSISAAEFRAPMLSQFDRVDTNKDGKISAAEERAASASASRK